MILVSFIVFLIAMTGIGVYSSTRSKKTTTDYILAGRDVGPIPMALSAVSTCHSGFMFIGMIGFTFKFGISAIWLIVGWVLGDLLAWLIVHTPLRVKTEEANKSTLSGFITGVLPESKRRSFQITLAVIITAFLSVYAAAQLTAGSKALNVMLNWPEWIGIIVGAVIVVAYCFSGGIRASIWTDVVQSILMVISMIGLLFVAIYTVGGISALWNTLGTIDPALIQLFPSDHKYGFLAFLLGWVAFGLGVIGQPHIMVRPMSLSDPNLMKKARKYYFSWYIIFSLAAIGVGLAARVLMPELLHSDPELALPKLATQLLPQVLVGAILAGLFSATISTADSQILTCSATLTQDLFPKSKDKLWVSKAATLITMLFVLLVAFYGSNSVFVLVVLAWSALAVSVGPLLLLRCFDLKVNFLTGVALLVLPLLVVTLWSQVFQLSDHINEVLPGLAVAVLIIGLSRLFSGKK
jgi:sodium/proline symporter